MEFFLLMIVAFGIIVVLFMIMPIVGITGVFKFFKEKQNVKWVLMFLGLVTTIPLITFIIVLMIAVKLDLGAHGGIFPIVFFPLTGFIILSRVVKN